MCFDHTLLSPCTERGCLLCLQEIKKSDKTAQSFSIKIWPALKRTAELWSNIEIDVDDKYFYKRVYNKVKDVDEAFGRAHKKCRTYFCSERGLNFYREKYKKTLSTDYQCLQDLPSCSKTFTRSQSEKLPKTHSYVCNEVRSCASNKYDEGGLKGGGGLSRCGYDKSKNRILERIELFLNQPDHPMHGAAKRLSLMLCGSSFDIFVFCRYILSFVLLREICLQTIYECHRSI